MTLVSEAAKLYVPARRVWETIGDFVEVARWHPSVHESEEDWDGAQRLRKLDILAGQPLVERLEDHDDDAMRYSYTIVSGPLPVRDYESTLSVHCDDATSCTVEWNGRFAPDGAPEAEAVELIRGIYRKGLEHLRFTLGG
jgi:hypothetical protein